MSSSSPPHQFSPMFGYALLLGLLMYVLLFVFVLFFSSNASADEKPETSRIQVMYAVLGKLEETDGGKFVVIEDIDVQNSLNKLIAEYALDHPDTGIYILNISQNMLVWSAAEQPTQYDTAAAQADVYDIQSIHDGENHLLVQNFWIKQIDGSRVEFRMVWVVEKS